MRRGLGAVVSRAQALQEKPPPRDKLAAEIDRWPQGSETLVAFTSFRVSQFKFALHACWDQIWKVQAELGRIRGQIEGGGGGWRPSRIRQIDFVSVTFDAAFV